MEWMCTVQLDLFFQKKPALAARDIWHDIYAVDDPFPNPVLFKKFRQQQEMVERHEFQCSGHKLSSYIV